MYITPYLSSMENIRIKTSIYERNEHNNYKLLRYKHFNIYKTHKAQCS